MSPNPHQRRQKRAFTMVELLTVIGIMALMFTLAVPAFNRINQGATMRAAEGQLQAGTMLARQKAVTLRQRVVFCIPTEVVTTNNVVRSDMIYRSFLLYAEETAGVGRRGTVIGKVETLSKGVVFTNDASVFGSWNNVTFLDDNDVTLFRAKGFRYAPTGSIYWKDADSLGAAGYSMILTEAMMADDGTVTYKGGGITSTSEVRTISGRCESKR